MVSALLCTNHNSFGQCKAKQIMKSCKPNVPKPYKYDAYVVTEFTFDDKETYQTLPLGTVWNVTKPYSFRIILLFSALRASSQFDALVPGSDATTDYRIDDAANIF